jgi:arginine exporter protein ArgO
MNMMRDDALSRAEDPATSFLLAEHARLSELYLSTREIAERRASLYFTLTTTVVGAVVALYQFQIPNVNFLETAEAATIALLLLGVITFHRLIERSMQGTEYLRAINRIHHYFVERAPEVEQYLYWPPHDDVPRYDFRGVGGAETREVVAIVDSAFFGAAVGLAVLVENSDAVLLAIIIGVVAFLIALAAHRVYEDWTIEREEQRKSSLVRFPQSSQNAASREDTSNVK